MLRETYLTFALWTSTIAIALWAIALMFGLAGHIAGGGNGVLSGSGRADSSRGAVPD